MAVYSINDLEKLSGIKAHTLRVWEQRYSIIQPKRTGSNIRYYDDSDLKHLLNIALLNKNGHKISKICTMSEAEIAQKVSSLSYLQLDDSIQIDALTISLLEMDEFKFNKIINANIKQIGFERTILEIIYPFLNKLGMMWLTGSINILQEYFISNVIKQKMIVAIENEPIVECACGKKFLLYLPENETQELSLLFMNYLLRKRGFRVYYFGSQVHLSELADIKSFHNPDFIFTLLADSFSENDAQKYINHLSTIFSSSKILLTGYQVANTGLSLPENVISLHSLEEVLQHVESLKV